MSEQPERDPQLTDADLEGTDKPDVCEGIDDMPRQQADNAPNGAPVIVTEGVLA